MHLRKLAWMAPLLVVASAAGAETVHAKREVREGAPFATVARVDSSSRAAMGSSRTLSAAPAEAVIAAVPAAQEVGLSAGTQAPASREEPNAPRDIKGLMALVGGLALVGWFQRRRRDA